ncbi:hypothetical protein HOD05_01210 [Candidatus Woesearchaeota archaeon]|jgi:hypothetical protein|nr:hypothetical protein [Candidatus Woesearchaeota archaeon]MBT4151025.1 hypothetical protein [Candidatus Woesearchaeota archaeon]MBT4247206.1 hypothetical protein [Candidatus Woesearchaeota archaeon]MBT4433815.1 hypothetical protein [Candidatus Woesearchaeota archaeon]MBT7332186.1 hypothetical protein [Candidatus Woesearchaeota archaeon]
MPKHKIANKIAIFPEFNPIRVKYKDIFDAKAFYESLHEWFQEQGWNDTELGTPEVPSDTWETYYGERVTGPVKEIWVWWRLTKPAPDAPYLHYYLDMDFHFIALGDTEIVKDGQKMKVNKGEVEMTINSFIEPKYEAEFAKHGVLKHVLDLFKKRVYNQTIETRKKELYQETYALQNYIKQWFKMKRYLPYDETKTFFPSQAWPSHQK